MTLALILLILSAALPSQLLHLSSLFFRLLIRFFSSVILHDASFYFLFIESSIVHAFS